MKKNDPKDGLLGLCAGDAMGVPVKFYSRNRLNSDPVTNMFGYGTYNQPPGTWSEDSSLCFCLSESLCNDLDYTDIADKYCKWLYEAYWTPAGKVIDLGQVVQESINRLKKGITPLEAGSNTEVRNSNGAVISILPIAYYIDANNIPADKKIEIIRQLTGILHKNTISEIAAAIYVQFALNLINGEGLSRAYENMCKTILEMHRDSVYKESMGSFSRILNLQLLQLKTADINISNTVIDVLEAGLWSLLTTHSYRETILTAVNLGGETDTIGAIAGGLAGIYYGYESIPANWLDNLLRLDDIVELGDKLKEVLNR